MNILFYKCILQHIKQKSVSQWFCDKNQSCCFEYGLIWSLNLSISLKKFWSKSTWAECGAKRPWTNPLRSYFIAMTRLKFKFSITIMNFVWPKATCKSIITFLTSYNRQRNNQESKFIPCISHRFWPEMSSWLPSCIWNTLGQSCQMN